MGWLFVQVWVLCVLSFVAGAAVTWLAFVRPRRGGAPAGGPSWTPVPVWASARRGAIPERPDPVVPIAPTAGPAADPALAALDARSSERQPAGSRATAASALDQLGVAGPGRAKIGIPTQAAPVDSPDPGRRRP